MKNQYRVNEQIRVREVRVVSEDGAEVMPTRKALDLARQQGVDQMHNLRFVVLSTTQSSSISRRNVRRSLSRSK